MRGSVMRNCRGFALAALIVTMPFGGLAQTEQISPPAGGDANLLQGCEIEWLLSKPESLTGGFEPWLGPKRVPSVAPGPVQSCFGYAPTWDLVWDLIKDFQKRDRLISSTYFSISVRNTPTSDFRGDFWRPGEFPR